MLMPIDLKRHYVVWKRKKKKKPNKNPQSCDIYSINEIIIPPQEYVFFPHNWINKQLSEESKVPKNNIWCFKGGRVRHI